MIIVQSGCLLLVASVSGIYTLMTMIVSIIDAIHEHKIRLRGRTYLETFIQYSSS